MDLDSMKYAELRSLAKQLGIKAKVKADKLLKAIKQHYDQEQKSPEPEEGQEQTGDAAVLDGNGAEDVPSVAVFVNTRRGNGTRTKRKIPEEPAEGETEVAVAPRDVTGAKKRKVSEEQRAEPEEEAPEPAAAEKAPKVSKAGKIPRLQQKNKAALKPVTPNFRKLHEAHFNKMESIDSYVQRKTKQMETFRTSAKEPKNPRASLFSPALLTGAAEDKRRLKAPLKRAADEAPFRPTVLSARRINVRFSEATRDTEHRGVLLKTPARPSCVASSTPLKQAAAGQKPNNAKASASKTPGAFVFTGNTSVTTTPGAPKIKFDLKASLSRPLGYKPHTGKLKPFAETKENAAADKSLVSVSSHQKIYKQHAVQTRGDRRAKQAEDRKQKKESLLGARRGLVMM